MDNLEKLKNYLKSVLDEPSYKKWIEPLKYIGTLENTLFLGAPEQKNLLWIKQNLLEDINNYTKKNFNFITKIVPLGEEENIQETARKPQRKISTMNRACKKNILLIRWCKVIPTALPIHFPTAYPNFPENPIIPFIFTVMSVWEKPT